MLTKRFHPVTPTRRFQHALVFLQRHQIGRIHYNKLYKLACKFRTKNGGNLGLGFRCQKTYPQPLITTRLYRYQKFITVKSVFQKTIKKELVLLKNC